MEEGKIAVIDINNTVKSTSQTTEMLPWLDILYVLEETFVLMV